MTTSEPEGFELSAQQRRRWGSDATSCVQAALSIEGALDAGALRRALEQVIARHQALRTTFRAIAGLKVPLQVVHEALAPAWEQAPGEPELETWLAREARPFDPAADSPVRARLVTLAPARHLMILTLSTLCADRPTLAIVAAELAEAYAGEQPAASDEDYLQLAAWQDSLLENDDGGATAFWREQVASTGRTATLLLEGERDGVRGLARRELGPETRARLAALALECGVSLRALLLAAFQRVLARFTADDGGVATWVTLDLRSPELLRDLCGAVEQDVPFAATLAEEPLRAHAARLERELLIASEHLPLYRPDREAALALPSLAIGFAHYEERALALPRRGVAFRWLWGRGREHADLFLCSVDTGEALRITCSHDRGRFSAGLVTALVDALVLSLERGRLDSRPGDLPLLPEPAGPIAQSETSPPTGVLHHLFAAQAARTPDRIAVLCDQHQLTFAQLEARASAIAHLLAGHGVRRGDAVALCLDRSSHMIAAIFGILKAGAAYAPIHNSYPAERIGAILDAASVRVVLADRSAPAHAFSGRVVLEVDGELPAPGASDREPAVTPDDLAYIIHTSGSTGAPKGVEVSHGSVVNLLHALRARVGLTCPSRFSINAPLAFDSSVKQWIQILDGHTVCVVPEDRRLEPASLWSFATEFGVDVLDCTPSQLRLLVDSGVTSGEGGPSVALVGGEAIDPALWAAMAAHERMTFHNVYGPTECTVDATTARVEGVAPTIGRAVDHCQVYVLDERLRQVPSGALGELYIGGAGVARGYRGRPAATAERFLPDPFSPSPGARMYRTGDLVCLREDGQLAFVGRRDGQVKLRGHRIELEEIASVLRRLAELRDAAVMVWPSRSGEPGGERLVAYVVPKAGVELRREHLREHLRAHLPEVMVPAAFVVLAELPLTSNGKLARDALPEPESQMRDAAAAPAALAGRTASIIAGIWQSVLGIDKIGLHDNFFDLGGHSLRMVQVHAKLREAFGREIPMVELFRHSTIAALSQYFDRPADQPEATRRVSDRADRRRAAVVSRANSKGRKRT